MNTILKYAGVVLLLLGVVCFVLYKVAMPANGLLVAGITLEIVGILAHVLLNKKF